MKSVIVAICLLSSSLAFASRPRKPTEVRGKLTCHTRMGQGFKLNLKDSGVFLTNTNGTKDVLTYQDIIVKVVGPGRFFVTFTDNLNASYPCQLTTGR